MLRIVFSGLTFMLLSGCLTTYQTYRSKPSHTYSYFILDSENAEKDLLNRSDYDYEKVTHYFFWGLTGNHVVSLQKACGKKRLYGFLARQPLGYAFGTIFTLGLWVPRKIEVWCEK